MPARRRLEVRALWFHSILAKERVKNRVALEGRESRVGEEGGLVVSVQRSGRDSVEVTSSEAVRRISSASEADAGERR